MALQLGHRVSVDLDLFSDISFDEGELSGYLISEYNLELDFIAKCTIKGEIEGVQIDCIAHRYPWLALPREECDIRLADLSDIAAMKLNAIAGNGTRVKDFIDVAYLSTRLSLNEMLNAYERKYKVNLLSPIKALTYFEDINFEEPIKMTGKACFNWKKIVKRLNEMQRSPDKKFVGLPV